MTEEMTDFDDHCYLISQAVIKAKLKCFAENRVYDGLSPQEVLDAITPPLSSIYRGKILKRDNNVITVEFFHWPT